ncbi:glutamate-1-semialdehyde aminotransferase [uncultured Sphaerochaeta sp.]|uniref:glutamate-1-semialdehyde aminotransferase n=1 Tax=uncultured Sphaerochaeta sp. TaxID=886478 RepID=UPI002A0A933C|nr:glutamate-1-semialdehyde aminotransferase [uncultured Sphaerochaeta sp.]
MKDTRHKDGEGYTMPVVVRARSFYLYDRYGVRYIDFFQNHGRAILGHRPEMMQRAIKSTVDRGLVSEYPSVFSGRLEKLLAQLFPGYLAFRIYSDSHVIADIARKVSPDAKAIYDPACPVLENSCKVSYWRPYLEVGGADSVLLFPILPFPGSFIPQVVCIKDQALADELPLSDCVSPLLLDLLIKATASLIHEMKSEESVVKRMDNPLKGLFETRGPYGITNLDDIRYREFYHEALKLRVVLPPTADIPFIIPGIYSKGDISEFLRLSAQYATTMVI